MLKVSGLSNTGDKAVLFGSQCSPCRWDSGAEFEKLGGSSLIEDPVISSPDVGELETGPCDSQLFGCWIVEGGHVGDPSASPAGGGLVGAYCLGLQLCSLGGGLSLAEVTVAAAGH
jgi:hypothetical protein